MIHKTVETDKSKGWHQAILSRLHSNQQPQVRFAFDCTLLKFNWHCLSVAPKKYCTYRPIEDKIQSHVERLRAEIYKRRHRIETECANDLGLSSPWRRARYYKKTREYFC